MKPRPIKFSYGAHATFPVRYGWLPKGLALLQKRHQFVANLETADELGLGSKMVESLAFWLEATGLSTARSNGEPTPLADLIWRHDRYFELPGTWWFLHLELVRNEGTVWSWFFNDFNERVFTRARCTDAFFEFARSNAIRPPTPATAQKDIACLLSSYSSRAGVDFVDPEDVGACPFRELGLILRDGSVDRMERSRTAVAMPIEAFLSAASRTSADLGKHALSLRDLANARLAPGKVFGCNAERIDDLLSEAAASKGVASLQVETLLGERHLRTPDLGTFGWLSMMYERTGSKAS